MKKLLTIALLLGVSNQAFGVASLKRFAQTGALIRGLHTTFPLNTKPVFFQKTEKALNKFLIYKITKTEKKLDTMITKALLKVNPSTSAKQPVFFKEIEEDIDRRLNKKLTKAQKELDVMVAKSLSEAHSSTSAEQPIFFQRTEEVLDQRFNEKLEKARKKIERLKKVK